MNPRLAIKSPAWAGWVVVLFFWVQVAGCKSQRSSNDAAQAVVVGDSMAPNLLGEHQCRVCSACGFEIVSEVVDPARHVVVCPNCGSRVAIEAACLTDPAAEVVLKVGQLPTRWQVIGFQRPTDQQASIKRVIGLPGEKVWFENGNVFLQTKNAEPIMLRKDWAQQRTTRVLVHDNRFQDQDSRWVPLAPASRLTGVVPQQFQTKDQHWFKYQSKRCYEHALGQSWTPRIEDAYGFNQGVSRQLNSVNEVCVEFEFDPAAEAFQNRQSELLVAIVVGEQTHLARFAFEGGSMDVQLFGRDQKLTAVTRCQIGRQRVVCGISNIDQQIIVVVGEKQICSIDLAEHGSADPVELLLSLRPSNPVDFERVRLWRDVYYFSSVPRKELLQRQAGTAGAEGYFVVGDNLPVSQDSRFWLRPRVEATDILGVVDIGQ